MNRLSLYECALSKDEQHILAQIDAMRGRWKSFTYFDVLQTYRCYDFLLKQKFLILIKSLSSSEAYSVLHEMWVSATNNMHNYFIENNLFPTSVDSIRLKDLIELSFFYVNQLVRLPSYTAVKPSISVIIPVYRAQQYIWETLRSVYEQTFQDFEVILVNEYKNDDPLEEIVSVFGDPRTYIVQKQEQSRLGRSLNLGIENARGLFIARMDADDIAHPERFSKQIDFFNRHPEIDFCGTQFRSFGTTNNWGEKFYPITTEEIQCRSLKYCSFLHPTVMWRREKLISNNLWYNENILAEDTDLFARIAYKLKTANLPDSLLLYRREENNLSNQNLKVKDSNHLSLAVNQSIKLEQQNLVNLYQSLSKDELKRIHHKPEQLFSYSDALEIFKHRLGRHELSDLLPPDTSKSHDVFETYLKDRIPVIWGYGWNGQVLEYTIREKGFLNYRIVDQRMQDLGLIQEYSHYITIEKLNNNSNKYYIIISMDKHFDEVTSKLNSYGYSELLDYVEYFV